MENLHYTYISIIQDICTRVIPPEVEKTYNNLIENINSYNTEASKLFIPTYKVNSDVDNLAQKRQEQKNAEEQDILKNIISKMITELNKTPESISFNNIEILSNKANKFQKIILKREEQVATASQNYNKSNKDLEDSINKIKKSINLIAKNLQEISSLDKNGKKRIDTLEFNDRHAKTIDNLNKLSSEQKEFLKQTLSIYLNMKLAAYKKAEELAPKVLEYYNERQQNPESFNYNNPYTTDLSLINDATDVMNKIYTRETLEMILNQNLFAENIYKEKINNDAITMASIESYLTTGKLIDSTKLLFEKEDSDIIETDVVAHLESAQNSIRKNQTR